MFKKNSLFIRVLVPVIAVMLFQSLLISLVLSIGGIFNSLDKSALDSLAQNMETRAVTLESMMTHYWSNLGKLEADITRRIDEYRDENYLTADQLLFDYDHQTALLGDISSDLINALRVTTSTGIFFCFVGEGDAHSTTPVVCNGLYYRDLDSVFTPADNSDIQFLRGYIDIARKDRIQLDSAWNEAFVFTPESEAWSSFANPLIAAEAYPDAASSDLAYWSYPYSPEGNGRKCITYTLPVRYEGRTIALLGSEVQMSQLEKLFPANDLSENGTSGYLLLKHDVSTAGAPIADIYAVTGSYIKRIVAAGSTEALVPSSRDGAFTIKEASEPVEIVMRPLHLYNNNAPFANERWALAAIGTDSLLFESSREVRQGLLLSSGVALIIGVFVLAGVVILSTRPLIDLATQIRKSDPNDPIITGDAHIYEVELLSSTINAMKDKRREAEARLMEERERYLIALESTEDTFLEYDVRADLFKFFYFAESGELFSRDFEQFSRCLDSLFHPDDIDTARRFVLSENETTAELRTAAPLLLQTISDVTDNGYRWFRVSGTRIHSPDGEYVKLIGTAREITSAKLSEFAKIDRARRDRSTGFFNRGYALSRLEHTSFTGHMICLRLAYFDRLETYFGRYFSAVVLRELCSRLRELAGDSDRAVRLANDELLLLFADKSNDELMSLCGDILGIMDSLYIGEDGPAISLRLGVSTIGGGTRGLDALQNARLAAYSDSASPIVFYDSLDDTQNTTLPPYAPTSVELEISANSIANFVFELFERTADVHSAIYALLPVLGRIFKLHSIVIYSEDADFGTSSVTHQWQAGDEDGTTSFDCAMYENGVQTGRLVFTSGRAGRVWSAAERLGFYETAKIIAAHLSIEKSNSASRAKSEFLSRISHEIRTPMNAILGMTAIAKAASDRKRLDDALDKIDFSAKHLLSLINDVLEMSRIEQGKLQIDHAAFSMKEFVQGIDTLMRPTIEQKGISLEIQNHTKHDWLMGDAYRLRQVIINFLGNAGKFTKPGGAIVFAAHELESDGETATLRFSVSDNGIGIDPDEQPFIFRAFEQAKSGGAERQGTGLGLTISANIVSAMGSEIELQSQPGVGSEFSFVLRLSISENKDDQKDGLHTTENRLAGRRVLLAEDNDINIEIATYILEDAGATVEVAKNGAEAVSMFASNAPGHYDIIIMDIQMPVMDGLAATRNIRKLNQRDDARDIPIIAMTANAFDRDMQKSIESGMNGHVAKPIDSTALFALIDSLLQSKGGDA